MTFGKVYKRWWRYGPSSEPARLMNVSGTPRVMYTRVRRGSAWWIERSSQTRLRRALTNGLAIESVREFRPARDGRRFGFVVRHDFGKISHLLLLPIPFFLFGYFLVFSTTNRQRFIANTVFWVREEPSVYTTRVLPLWTLQEFPKRRTP